MPRFALNPLTTAEFDGAGEFYQRFDVETTLPVADVWSELHTERPLGWCKALRSVRWLTPSRQVGSTREVALAPGVKVYERYIEWVETETQCQNAFHVEHATVPGLDHFGERYTVSANDHGGSTFRWEFIIAPRFVPTRLAPAVNRVAFLAAVRGLERDTRAHFRVLEARAQG